MELLFTRTAKPTKMTSELTDKALQALFVLAIRQPSVVAIGTMYFLPSNNIGPANPTGMGMYPITFSAQAPSTNV